MYAVQIKEIKRRENISGFFHPPIRRKMRKDYDVIKQTFKAFIDTWKSRKTDELNEIVKPNVHAYFSAVKEATDGGQHSSFGVKDFILDIPKTDEFEYAICNYVCRIKGKDAQQVSEVACTAANHDGQYFKFIAVICNSWVKENDKWLISEMRVDIKHFESPLLEQFAETWHFEEPLAVLSGLVHLPCIFSEIDSPYAKIPVAEDLLTEEEKVEECFIKFNYGIDWIMYRYVKETLADDFKNDDKRHFIAYTKFANQRYRYTCHPYITKLIEINGNNAVGMFETVIPENAEMQVEFIKEKDKWQILSIESGQEG